MKFHPAGGQKCRRHFCFDCFIRFRSKRIRNAECLAHLRRILRRPITRDPVRKGILLEPAFLLRLHKDLPQPVINPKTRQKRCHADSRMRCLGTKRFIINVKQRRGFNRLEKRIIGQMFPCGMRSIHTIERFPDSIGILGPSMETLGNALALFKGEIRHRRHASGQGMQRSCVAREIVNILNNVKEKRFFRQSPVRQTLCERMAAASLKDFFRGFNRLAAPAFRSGLRRSRSPSAFGQKCEGPRTEND